MKLYELAEAYRRVMDDIETSEGELSPTLEADLDAIEGPFEDKIEACCSLRAEFRGNAAMGKAEIGRLSRTAAVFGNAEDRMTKYIQTNMEKAGVTKIRTSRFLVWIQNSTISAKWTGDPDAVPPEFMRWKTSVEFDAASAIESHQAGEKLPEGVVVGQGRHLRVK